MASPKAELTALPTASPRAGEPILPILTEIAKALDPKRCQHAGETGFARFHHDIRDEIVPLAAP